MPCHAFFQLYVAGGRLSCQLYQRSADIFLGVPFNIASYALLTHMFAQQCDLEPGEFVWTGGDCHLYLNHLEQADLQLSRTPYPLPQLRLLRRPADHVRLPLRGLRVRELPASRRDQRRRWPSERPRSHAAAICPIEVRDSGAARPGRVRHAAHPKGTRVLEYLGERITHAEADRRYDDKHENDNHTFLFIVDSRTVIDAGADGNEARFVNHCCDPNCESVHRGPTRLHRGDPRHRRRARSSPTTTRSSASPTIRRTST